jgi:putative ABC transport system ATP-binding protein
MGQRLSRRTEAERAARRATEIGLVLQSGNLFDHFSVEEHLHFQMRLAHRFNRQRLEALLTMVDLLHRRAAHPAQLSGGEAARAALAVALASEPLLLLADEPTGEVDAETEQQVLHLFNHYRQQGGALLLVTHSDEVAAVADRILRLHDGRLSHD